MQKKLIGLGVFFILALVLGIVLVALPAFATNPTGITVTSDNSTYTTIQSAINAAASGATITVPAGTYDETLNLGGKSLTIQGAGIGATIIDAGAASDNTVWAVQNFGNGSTIEDLMLIGTQSYGFKISHVSGITFNNVKVENSYHTAFDVNTVSGAQFTNIEADNTAAGFGMNIVDSSNIVVNGVTTSGNAWGGVTVQTVNAASNNVQFSGVNAQEAVPFFLEQDPSSTNTYYPITNVPIPSQFEYAVYTYRAPQNYKQTFYFATLADATAYAQSLVAETNSTSPTYIYSQTAVFNTAGTEYYVSPGLNIQDAVNLAAAGATINVAAGTYNENITISQPLTLDGAQAGVDARTRNGSSGESIIDGGGACLTVNSSNVTIDGFKLMGPVNQGTAALVMPGPYSGQTVQNNIVVDPGRAVSYDTSDTLFKQNVILESASTGDGIQQNSGTVSNVTIQDNQFSNGAYNNADITIISTAAGSSTINVIGNTSSNTSTLVAVFNSSGVTITGNTVNGTTGSAVFIGGGVSNATINNNSISGAAAAIVLYNWNNTDGPNTGVSISNNTLNGNNYGIKVDSNALSATLTAHNNQIVGNTTGVSNDAASGGLVNATKNYWGTANVTAIGGMVSGEVYYDPYYSDASMTTLVQNLPVYDSTQGIGFTTIQAAINGASSGDTINLAAGTYNEDILNGTNSPATLGKQINLIGATDASGAPTSTINGSLMYALNGPTITDNVEIENINFVVNDATLLQLWGVNGLTIKNCTFDGGGRYLYTGTAAGAWLGIDLLPGSSNGNSDITIEDCTFENGLFCAIQGYASGLTVKNSTIENVLTGINQQGGSDLNVTNTPISVIAKDATQNTFAIRFGSSQTTNMNVSGGSLSVNSNNITPNGGVYFAAIIVRSAAQGTLTAQGMSISGSVVNLSTTALNATHNYWGTSDSGTIAAMVSGDVLYDPYYSDAGMTALVHNKSIYDSTQDVGFDTIQQAVDYATANDTILVASGNYTLGQMVFGKSVTIAGQSPQKPVFEPSANFTGSKVAQAWLTVSPGVTFNLSNIVIDGGIHFVSQALCNLGTTTLTNVDFRNIRGSVSGEPYQGIGVENFGGSIPGGAGSDVTGGPAAQLTATGCTFANMGRIGILVKGSQSTATVTDCTYTGKGDGDWLDYAVEAGAGGNVTINGGTVTDCTGVATVDGSTSAAYLATDYYGPGTTLTVNGADIENNYDGIAVGFLSTDSSVVVAHNNTFIGNHYGVDTTGPFVNATKNWWGTADAAAIAGMVNGNVAYDPYYGSASMTADSLVSNKPVYDTTQDIGFDTIQEAIDNATPGDVISLKAESYNVTTPITVSKPVTIEGAGLLSSTVQGMSDNVTNVFDITADNVTLENLLITHTALQAFPDLQMGETSWTEVNHSLVRISNDAALSGVTIENNAFVVPPQAGDMSTWNGIAIAVGDSGSTGITLTGNIITGVRDGIVVRTGNTATISNNFIFETKGGIMNYTTDQTDADNRTITNNSWGPPTEPAVHNEWDIVWNTAYYVPANQQQNVLALAEANNGAYVLDRRAANATDAANLIDNRSHVFVNATGSQSSATPAGGNMNDSFTQISLGLDAVVPGGTVDVGPGVYTNNLDITKNVILQGAGTDSETGTVLQSIYDTPPTVPGSAYSSWVPIITVSANGTTESPLTISNMLITVQHNMVSGQLAGILVQPGVNVTNLELDNVKITGTQSTGTFESGLVVDGNGSVNNLAINNSAFTDMAYGVTIYNTAGTGTVAQNVTITNTTFDSNSIKGFYAEKLSDATFTDDIVTNNGIIDLSPSWAIAHNAGIDINLKYGNYQNITFNNLTVTGNGLLSDQGGGLLVKARGTGNDPSYSADPATLTGVTVNGGTFTGNEAGIRFGHIGGDNTGPTAVTVENATISGNTLFGMDSEVAGATVTAVNNYWGTANGPASTVNTYNTDNQGNSANGTLSFAPWLVAPGGASFAPVTNGANSYASIQVALDAAASGDTVSVMPGTFTENITITQPVTLDGAQAGNDARLRDGSGSESVIDGGGPCITVNSDNVTIDGMMLNGPLSQGTAALVMPAPYSGETIQNNIISDPGRAVSYDTSNTLFQQNLILESATTGDGIQQNSGTVSNVTIQNNKFSNGANNNADITIISTAAGSSNINIIGNTSSNTSTLVAVFHSDNVTIENNSVTGATGAAIYIGGDVSDASITSNSISGSDVAIDVTNWNNQIGANGRGLSITNNILTANNYGIMVGAGSLSATLPVHYNTLQGNTTGVSNNANSGGTVDATNNYWGSANGPTDSANTYNAGNQGDTKSGTVSYVPWLIAPGGASFSPVTNGSNDYSSIQAALDAAPAATTVNVAAGSYNETLTISKPVTLNGAQAGVEPRALVNGIPSGALRSGPESVITSTYALTIQANDVTVNGFTFDGFRYGINTEAAPEAPRQNVVIEDNILTSNKAWVGILVGEGTTLNSGEPGTFSNIVIANNSVDVSASAGSDPYALSAVSFTGSAYFTNVTFDHVTVSQNYITNRDTAANQAGYDIFCGANTNGFTFDTPVFDSNYIYGGITGINLGNLYNATVNGNYFYGNGYVGAQIGIIGGSVTDNTFNGNYSSEFPGYPSYNLELWGTQYGFPTGSANVSISGNTFNYNQSASANETGNGVRILTGCDASTININQNQFFNYYAAQASAVVNQADGYVNATNNQWSVPVSGTAVTSSSIQQVVSANVTYDPWHLKAITVSPVTANQLTTNSVILNWESQNNTLWSGDFYDFRYSTSPISAANWNSAIRLTGEPAPTQGLTQQMIIRGLSSNTTYYFGFKAASPGYNAATNSGYSSVITTLSAKTLSTVAADTTPPSAVNNLTAAAGSPATTKAVLNWTAVGDNGLSGFADHYVIKRSTSTITAGNFNTAPTVYNSLAPRAPGQAETFTVSNLLPNTTYYFAIEVFDAAGNHSLSNTCSLTTANNLPTVTGITPVSATSQNSTAVSITGTNFLSGTIVRLISNQSGNQNVLTLTSTNVTSGHLNITVPAGAPVGTYHVTVTNGNGTSALSSATYTVNPAPIPVPSVTNVIPSLITSGSPTSGVQIIGENLKNAQSITVDGQTINGSSFTVNSDGTVITATIPALSEGLYDVKVTTPSGTNEISSVQLDVKTPVTVTDEDTTTSDIVSLSSANGTTQGQLTLTTNNSDNATQNTAVNAQIQVVIPPSSKITTSNGTAYTGTINPPRVVKPNPTVQKGLASNAVVIEMGNPNESILFPEGFVTTVSITANATAPKVYYFDQATGIYSLAGITGTKDGIDYVPGGVVLNREEVSSTEYIYTIGLLLDHMSTYVASTTSLLPPPPVTPTPTPVFGGTAPTIPAGNLNVQGMVTGEGRFTASVTAVSADALCNVNIPVGTVGLDANLQPISTLSITPVNAPPAAPAGNKLLGLAYEIGPSGATFDPAITVTFHYNPAAIPAGVDANNLVIAFYDTTTGQWVNLSGIVVDTASATISGQVTHFTTFAVFAPPVPASFTLSNLVVTPTSMTVGATSTIEATVTNVGGSSGTYTVTLAMNGETVNTQTVSLAAGASTQVKFTVTPSASGQYTISVNKLSATLMINPMTTPTTTATPTQPAPTQTPTPTATQPAPTTAQPTPTVTPAPSQTSTVVTPTQTQAPAQSTSGANLWLIIGLIAVGVIAITWLIIYTAKFRRD